MKKILAMSLSLSLLLSACSSKTLTEVKPSVVIDQFEQSETFVVYLGLSYCSACKIFRSIIETVMKTEDELEVLYIEYDKEIETEAEDLNLLITNHLQQKEAFLYSFPILYVVKDGLIIDQFSLQQTDTEAEFIARMVKNGVITE